MEVQNWATLTDYGAMVTRLLEPDERKRYLALKAIHLKDSEIWRLFHPQIAKPIPPTPPNSDEEEGLSSFPSLAKVSHGSTDHSYSIRRRPRRSSYHPSEDYPGKYDPGEYDPDEYDPGEDKGKNSPQPNPTGHELDLDISIRDLSKRALLHIIQKACARDIEALKTATYDELLSLASTLLPLTGVRVMLKP